jgi:hypothetical protein
MTYWPKAGGGANWRGQHIMGVFESPLLHRRSICRRAPRYRRQTDLCRASTDHLTEVLSIGVPSF